MKRYYWDMEKCTWGNFDELSPEETSNLEEIIDLANQMMDDYVEHHDYDPDFDVDEIREYSNRLWERYCSTGFLRKTRWEIRKYSAEHKFKDLCPGCGIEEENGDYLMGYETIAKFETKEEGVEAISKIDTLIDDMGRYLVVTECALELVAWDDLECEWRNETGDVWEFSIWPKNISHNGECTWNEWAKKFEAVEEEED